MAKATRKVITPVGTLSFPNLSEPNEKGKYGASIVFAPDTDLSDLQALLDEAVNTIVPSGVNTKALKPCGGGSSSCLLWQPSSLGHHTWPFHRLMMIPGTVDIY